MKKIFFALGLMAAAFTLTNCAKQETAIKDAQPAKAGVPFSFNVGIDTKTTTTDGATISWAEEDALNVFHAEAGSTTYGSNDEFTLTSGTTFNGELQDGALTADAYDWYVIYPYNSHVVTPASTSAGFLTVGSAATGSQTSQTQVGASNMAHLAGSKIPLYGVAKGVKKGEALSMTLNQLVSVVKISVKNSTAAALPVTKVFFTAPVDVVGTYYLDITGSEVVYTPSGAKFVSNTAKLDVTDATIAAGATEDFYIAIKPFSASSGKIKVTVNEIEKGIDLTSETNFASGKIKTIDYDYTGVADYVSVSTFANTASVTGTGADETATWTNGDITVSAVKMESKTAFRSTDTDHVRFYKDWKITVSSASKTISQIVFDCAGSGYATDLANCAFTAGTAKAEGSSVTVSGISESSTSVTLGDRKSVV